MRHLFLFLVMIFLSGGRLGSHFLLPEVWNKEEKSLSSATIDVAATVYWGVNTQTDSTPTVTASQKKFNPYDSPRYIALSRDLVYDYSLKFGDTIYVHGPKHLEGWWIYEDHMNKRWCNKIDFLVPIGQMGRYNIKITVPCNTCKEIKYYKAV